MGPTVDGTEFVRGQKDEDEEVEESIQEEICQSHREDQHGVKQGHNIVAAAQYQ